MDENEVSTPNVPPMPPQVTEEKTFEPVVEDQPEPAEGYVGRTDYQDDTERKATDLKGVAQEVLEGKWGRGQDRRVALDEAGWDPNEVAEEVLDLLNPKS